MFDVAINGRMVEERFEMPGAFAERCVMRRVWEARADADGIVEAIYALIKDIRQGKAPEPGDKLVPMMEITKANVAKYK